MSKEVARELVIATKVLVRVLMAMAIVIVNWEAQEW